MGGLAVHAGRGCVGFGPRYAVGLDASSMSRVCQAHPVTVRPHPGQTPPGDGAWDNAWTRHLTTPTRYSSASLDAQLNDSKQVGFPERKQCPIWKKARATRRGDSETGPSHDTDRITPVRRREMRRASTAKRLRKALRSISALLCDPYSPFRVPLWDATQRLHFIPHILRILCSPSNSSSLGR